MEIFGSPFFYKGGIHEVGELYTQTKRLNIVLMLTRTRTFEFRRVPRGVFCLIIYRTATNLGSDFEDNSREKRQLSGPQNFGLEEKYKMCGIVGYIGNKQATEVLLEGLSRLEYRGYDSAGVAIFADQQIRVEKRAGRLANLAGVIEHSPIQGQMGIGHTRWATHGAPSDQNSHPHTNGTEEIAVVHNGIIENYMDIKQWLQETHKIEFRSETDSEVIAHLIAHYYEGDLKVAVQKATARLQGAYAIAVMSQDEPDRLIAVRKDSPLIVGKGENESFIASDIPAILKYTRDVYFLENGELVDLKQDEILIFDEFDRPVEREVFHVNWDLASAEKEGYPHFMLKEIEEQPAGVRETLNQRLSADGNLNLEGLTMTSEDLAKVNQVVIVACGTAYHAGLIGKALIERYARIPVTVDVASEFRYRDLFVDEQTLFIAVSQSGETLDTLAALREAKRRGARVLAICNVVGSSVAREADDVMYTWAGPEIAVASTKAFTTQLMAFQLMALRFAELRGVMSPEEIQAVIHDLEKLPDQIQQVLNSKDEISNLANQHFHKDKVLFLGRGMDSDIALEGSLKLKEISYINSFAIAAGEMKHGTIALIEEGTLVICLATQEHVYEKTLSNMKEVKARGAYVVAIVQEDAQQVEDTADVVIRLPKTNSMLTPILSVLPMQLLAYYTSIERGNDVDKPRNLAKSVTVE
jgi:glucosamine--fructose-6-phosphate aminotransferase (isomerizing)